MNDIQILLFVTFGGLMFALMCIIWYSLNRRIEIRLERLNYKIDWLSFRIDRLSDRVDDVDRRLCRIKQPEKKSD